MDMPGRQISSTHGYRYGFNGKEKDKEGPVQYDYGFRIYDPRLVRFKSVDPCLTFSYPYYTPYQFAGNIPIAAIDLDGLEQHVVIYFKDHEGNTTHIQIRRVTDNKGELQDQHVHKVGETKDIAKGNVLVFEAERINNNAENFKIVKKRNTPDSKLTPEEEKILNKNKRQEGEMRVEQRIGYGGRDGNGEPSQFESKPFLNADTKTFSSNVAIINFQPKFELLEVYGDNTNLIPTSAGQAKEIGKNFKDAGVKNATIQPICVDNSAEQVQTRFKKMGKHSYKTFMRVIRNLEN